MKYYLSDRPQCVKIGGSTSKHAPTAGVVPSLCKQHKCFLCRQEDKKIRNRMYLIGECNKFGESKQANIKY